MVALLLWSAPTLAQTLFWTEPFQDKVQSGSVNGTDAPTNVFDPTNGVLGPVGIAVDESSNFVYFSDGGSTIKRGRMDGSGLLRILFNASDGLVGVHGLAIDFEGNRIFWADKDANTIKVGNINGVGPTTTLFGAVDGLNQPHDVAVDIAGGFIYWANFGGAGSIMRGNIDGSETPIELFNAGPSMGIAVDPATGKVFWTDFFEGEILSGNSDGSGSPTVLFDYTNGVDVPSNIEHDPINGLLYWTTSFGNHIQRGSDDGVGPTLDVYTSADSVNLPAYLAIVQTPPPPRPTPMVPGQRIYWTGDGGFRSAPLNGSGTPTMVYSRANAISVAMGIEANIATGDLYWSGPGISRGRIDGTVGGTIIFDGNHGVHGARGLEADFEGGKLYWAERNWIKIGNLDGTGVPQVLFGDDPDEITEAIDVAIDLAGGKIYWTDSGNSNNSNDPKIEVGNIDGSGSPTVLYDDSDGLISPYGIAIDTDAGLLYWSDEDTAKIQVANIDGSGSPTDLYTAADGFMEPQGITLDKASGTLYICDFATGIVAATKTDGTDVTELYGPSDGLEHTRFVIVNTAPPIPFSIVGLPASSPKSLALSTVALIVAAGAVFFGADVRRRRRMI